MVIIFFLFSDFFIEKKGGSEVAYCVLFLINARFKEFKEVALLEGFTAEEKVVLNKVLEFY